MSALAVVPLDDVVGRLVALLRPEFDVAVFRPDPDDPVLAGERCAVAPAIAPPAPGACVRSTAPAGPPSASPTWPVSLPPPSLFGPAVPGSTRCSISRPCRHVAVWSWPWCCSDDTTSGAGESGRWPVRPVVAMLAASGVDSLLERPLDAWVASLPPGSRTKVASATGFLRYAWRHVEAVVGGDGVEGEYARDRWDARRLGVPVTVGHHSVSFERIPQPWLRTAVKGWARARLVGGMSFGAIRRDTTAMSWFAGWLAGAHPGAPGASAVTRTTLEGYLAHLSAHGPAANTRLGYLTSLRGFLETARR